MDLKKRKGPRVLELKEEVMMRGDGQKKVFPFEIAE